MKKGVFISFEGSEAVGKSTLIKKLSQILIHKNIPHITTREPGGTELAENIRNLIFHSNSKPSTYTELLLLFAARRDHIETIIQPALEAHKIILCDRYIDSSYIYQSTINGINSSVIDMLVHEFVAPTLPDMCFIVDCDAQTSYERIQKRGIENFNDDHSIQHFQSIRNAFLARPQDNAKYPYHIVENIHIDTSVQEIFSKINSIIK